MKRDKYNISLYKGESFAMSVSLKDSSGLPINLTGAVITSQCRDNSSNALLFSFVCTPSITPADGKFVLSLAASVSGQLTPQKNASYDVKIVWPSNEVKKYLSGNVQIFDTITA
jgi:hypothetical protein